MAHIIQPQVDCSLAQEFLDALSPLGPYFGDEKPNEPWLFRGQGRDDPLIPSALRKNGKLALLTHRNIKDIKERRLAERDILIQFFDIADKRGLILPDDSQQLRSHLETLRSEKAEDFIALGLDEWDLTDKSLSLVALAQHHGIPTRLLDWTRLPFIAAFFAAESAFNYTSFHGDMPTGCLVVWSFYFPELGRHDEIAHGTDPVRVVTAPSATNANLKAQQGVFTLLSRYYTGEDKGDYPSMEEFLESLAKKADPEHSDSDKLVVGCKLRKFTLPVSEVRELLYLLAKSDITPSAVYPGYHSIVRDLQMQNLW